MKKLILCFTIVFVQNVLAQNNVKFNDVILNGTGCPKESTSTTLDPSQTTLSILFDRFMVQVPQTDGINDNDDASDDNSAPSGRNDREKSHKVCNMIIRGKLPKGHKASLEISFDFRGFSQVDKGVKASFKSILIDRRAEVENSNPINGNQNRQILVEKKWMNESEENWNLNRKINMELNSNCNKNRFTNFQLKLKNSILLHITNRKSSNVGGLVVMDSADILSKTMRFKVITSKCF